MLKAKEKFILYGTTIWHNFNSMYGIVLLLTEKNIRNRQAFGIEIERQDFNDGQVVNLERDYVSLVASEEKRANDILLLLFNNLVSPIHLVDIVGEYSDLCAAEF